jgi:hypothetical protein
MAKIPKHFSLVKEHPHSYELHDARDKSNFHVAKKDLDLQMHAKLAGIQHFDEGGSVKPTGWNKSLVNILFSPATDETAVDTAAASQKAPQAPQASANDPNLVYLDSPQPSQAQAAQTAPPQQQQTTTPQPSSGTPSMPGDILGQFMKNSKAGEQALSTMGQEQAAKSAEEAQAYIQPNQLMQDAQENFQKKVADLDAENKQLSQAVLTSKIDPDRYVSNMSTGNKIAAAIGIALGGIGGGLSGKPNQALEIIRDAINKDVESQKSELGTKENLLSKNLQKYGDLDRATQATMMQLNAITQGKIAQIAAKHGAGINQANTQMMLSELQNKNLIQGQEFARSMAINGMRQQVMGGNVHPDTDPATLVQYLVPAEHQKKAFDEIEAAQNTNKNAPQILEAFDKAAKNYHMADMIPGVDNADQQQMHALLGPTFQDVEGTVRQAAMDNLYKNITPQFGDTPEKIDTKRQSLVGYLNSKGSAPTAKGFGIDLHKFNSTRPVEPTNYQQPSSQQAQQYLQWAKQNPNDPRSAAVLRKLGIR